MGFPNNMNIGLFWETSISFLKGVGLQVFSKYSQTYANLNVRNRVILVFSIKM